MATKTLSGAAGVLYGDRRKFYMNENSYKELWPTTAPFRTLVSNRGMVTGLPDPIFKMFEHRDPWVKQQFTNASSTGSVPNNNTGLGSITVSNIVGLPAMDSSWLNLVVECWDATLTVRRGAAVITAQDGTNLTMKNLSTTAFTLVVGDIFRVIGTAKGEGDTAVDAWADELKVVWGATQILETSVEVTGTLYQAALRGYSNELARLRSQKQKEQQMKIEQTLLFGQSLIGMGLADSRDGTSNESFSDTWRSDAGSKTIRTAMGLVTAIEKYGASSGDDQNLFDIVESSYSYKNFVDDMEKVFHYYPDGGVKYAFCGAGAISYWSKIATGGFTDNSGWKVQLSGMQQSSLGFNVRMLDTPHGSLALVPTPALRGPYNKYMVVVSDNNLTLVQYRPGVFLTNIKTENAYDGEKDLYRDDLGLGMTLIESHKRFKIV